MIGYIAKYGRHAALGIVAACLIQAAADADRITFDGQTWNDVLVYKSSTMYYVKVPEDGTIFNVPMDAVAPSSVEIVRDPWYRDELRKRFEQNAGPGSRSSSDGVGASVFNVSEIGTEPESEESVSSSEEAVPELESTEGAARAAVTVNPVMSMLQNLQFTISNEDGNVVATSPDGATTILFVGGSPEGGVEYSSTVPEASIEVQKRTLGVLGNLAGQTAPWAPEFLQQEVAPLLDSGGSAEKSEGALSIAANVTKADGNVTVNITATPNPAT